MIFYWIETTRPPKWPTAPNVRLPTSMYLHSDPKNGPRAFLWSRNRNGALHFPNVRAAEGFWEAYGQYISKDFRTPIMARGGERKVEPDAKKTTTLWSPE